MHFNGIIINGDKMKKLVCAILGLALLSGCSSSLKKYSMTATDLGFDTVVSFIAYTENEATFNRYGDTLKEEFKRYDQLFDKYDSYEGINNIKTINEQAGEQPVKVDAEIIELLQQSKLFDTISNHKFDVTMGSVLNLWHDTREAGLIAIQNGQESSIPEMNALQQAKEHTGWDHVHIDEENSTVYIDDKLVSLDVGGSAKGFAVEKVAQRLEKDGLQHAIINGGGNIRLIGDKPEEEYWSVGVQIPNLNEQSTDSLVSIMMKESTSFVTSGDYQRYYMYQDQIMHHIIDPDTLMPARHCRSVTVVTKDSGIADILSTTLYTMSHQEGEAFLKELKENHDIEANAIWVYDEQQPKEDTTESIKTLGYDIIISEGLKDKIKE